MIGADLDRSIDLIGEHLGHAPRHFAYPKALPPHSDADVEVRRRLAAAAGAILSRSLIVEIGQHQPFG